MSHTNTWSCFHHFRGPLHNLYLFPEDLLEVSVDSEEVLPFRNNGEDSAYITEVQVQGDMMTPLIAALKVEASLKMVQRCTKR